MIDSHAHVADSHFDSDRLLVAERARAHGVRWVEIGTTVVESEQAIALVGELSGVVVGATVGVHPNHAGDTIDWLGLEKLLTDDRVVAVGEVGLDYSRGGTLAQQQPMLERFVQLALREALPMVFHVRSSQERDAHEDMLSFLGTVSEKERPGGVMHTFSGTWNQAQRYLDLGLFLSLSGVVTFKNAPHMHEVARNAPLDRLLIETDCPYLTPEPHRGQRNEPAHVALVAREIAKLRGISLEEVTAATEQNARALFRL